VEAFRNPRPDEEHPIDMKTLVSVALALSLVAVACGDDDATTTSTDPDSTIDRGAVFLGTVEFLYLESYPVQVQAILVGNLPTPCHELKWKLDATEPSAPDLEVWSEIDITVSCIQVLEPFEETIPIGSFETGSYDLTVNGETHPFEV
jgi:hypothetical protein